MGAGLSVTLGLGTLAPSGLGGNDFAIGGAETGATPQNGGDPEILAISLPAQLAEFQALSSPSANALYTLSIGANDLLDIFGDAALTPQAQTTDIADAVANEVSFIGDLAKDGAKDFVVMNVPDLGKTPEVMDGLANASNMPSAAFDAEASQLTADYNSDLSSQLTTLAEADALNVHVLDAYALVDNAVTDPLGYGLTDVTSPVWSGNFTSDASGTLARPHRRRRTCRCSSTTCIRPRPAIRRSRRRRWRS